jgi:NADH:ubiquinone oxidoreductase subunit H
MYDFSARNMNMVTKIVLLCHIFLGGWNFVCSARRFLKLTKFLKLRKFCYKGKSVSICSC